VPDRFEWLPDEKLMLLLATGDVSAFDEIYSRHFKAVYQYAFNILKSEEECSDAVQEIFIWLWENRERLHIESLRSYLLAAVKYKLVRRIKTSKRQAAILSAHVNIDDHQVADLSIEVKELKKVINDFITFLPPRARAVFVLSRQHHLSNKKIAAKLEISEKTVENQITLSLRKLKIVLGRFVSFIIY
jgi:RNA polymerase sigma-70 factor (ECF subfamily)